MIADAHAHLDDRAFSEDLDEVIGRARAAGVKAIISNGLNPESNRRVLELGKKYDIIKCALGIYPQEAEKLDDESITNEIRFIIRNKKLVERIIKNKWLFSIPPSIIRSSHFQMIAGECPLSQLLTETDSPHL